MWYSRVDGVSKLPTLCNSTVESFFVHRRSEVQLGSPEGLAAAKFRLEPPTESGTPAVAFYARWIGPGRQLGTSDPLNALVALQLAKGCYAAFDLSRPTAGEH
jgi:hypothetical protein